MSTTQNHSILSIWTKPREAIRYYMTKQTIKLEHLMMLLASIPLAICYSTYIPLSAPLAFLTAFAGYYLSLWMMSYMFSWVFTATARWFKGRGTYKSNRLVFLLHSVALAPFTLLSIPVYLCQPISYDRISMNILILLVSLLSLFATFFVMTLQLRYASEVNRFSKRRAFFSGVIAMLIPTVAVLALSFLL